MVEVDFFEGMLAPKATPGISSAKLYLIDVLNLLSMAENHNILLISIVNES